MATIFEVVPRIRLSSSATCTLLPRLPAGNSAEALEKIDSDGISPEAREPHKEWRLNGTDIAEQTKVIHRSPQFGIPPVVVPSDLPFHLKQSLRSVFLRMHTEPAGKRILEQMRIEKFVEVPDANYDSIGAMSAFIENKATELSSAASSPGKKKSADDVILFGVLPRDNPILAYERYQPLMDYLTEATGISTELHLEQNYQGIVNSLGQQSSFWSPFLPSSASPALSAWLPPRKPARPYTSPPKN